MKKRWALTDESLFLVAALALALVFLTLAFRFPSESRLFPLFVTVPLSIGLAARLVASAHVAEDAPVSTASSRAEYILAAGWMIGLIATIWLVGLVPAMFIIPFVYMRFYCGESWKLTLLVATSILALTSFFMSSLQIPPLTGVLEGAIVALRTGLGL